MESACIQWGPDGVARSVTYGDVYASTQGAWGQAEHVFLQGNQLPERWSDQPTFAILETGFGLGTNFLATWKAWKADPHRCQRLTFISIEKHPPSRADLERAHAASGASSLALELVQQWPVLTPNFHLLDFEGGQVRLILAWGDVRQVMPQIVAEVDAFYLDGFAPTKNPQMWDSHLLRGLQRLARPGATVATWCAARHVREALRSGGFDVQLAPGFGRKKDMTVGHFAPTFQPKRPAGRQPMAGPGAPYATRPKRAVIVGAGLAGAHAAQALAQRGWQCTVLDQHPHPASGASGNPAGIFHPTLHAADNVHARLLRAASGWAHRCYRELLQFRDRSCQEGLPWEPVASSTAWGACHGLLRTEPSSVEDDRKAPPLKPRLQDSHDAWVQTLSPEVASQRLGVPLSQGGLWFPQAGWMNPVAVVEHLLQGAGIDWKGSVEVHSLTREGEEWALHDASGRELGRFPLVVLAAGHLMPRLLKTSALATWPADIVRGQVTWWQASDAQSLPNAPIAGSGYGVALPDRRIMCGATAQVDDLDPEVRSQDHAFNLQRWADLVGETPASQDFHLEGRVSWRLSARDRLPVVGALPVSVLPHGTRADQVRFIPRQSGLFALGALGSRGLTWAPLLAEVLAAWVEGGAFPIEADLLDALDPARWLVRQRRSELQSTHAG